MTTGSEITFTRQAEPHENAFTLLVPAGWQLEGGIIRISPLTHSVQSLSANVDLAVKSDAQGTLMIRFLPSITYFDPRRSPLGMMGMMPFGSSYQGMPVYPVMPPAQFLGQIVFPYVHQGQAPTGVEMVAQRERPDLIQQMEATGNPLLPGSSRAAGEIQVHYTENGQGFEETAAGVIQDPGQMGAGMWSNHQTTIRRAPQGEMAGWERVFDLVAHSIQPNPAWQREEQRAQQIATGMFMEQQQAEQLRARRALDAQRDLQASRQELVDHRRQSNAEARNDAYLFLTGQEEYLNPYTGEVDTGSNQWSHRWVTADGREFYSDNESANPNDEASLRQWEWQRTPIRPRDPA